MLNIRIPTLLLLLCLLLTGLFVTLNWQVFLAPTALSFGVATLEFPLGVVMLTLLVLIVSLFLIYVVYLQGQALIEARHFARELRANQAKADNAEASRFTEVHKLIRAEMAQLTEQHTQNHAALTAALDRLHEDLSARVTDTVNTVAAYVGELEDRMEAAQSGKPGNY